MEVKHRLLGVFYDNNNLSKVPFSYILKKKRISIYHFHKTKGFCVKLSCPLASMKKIIYQKI